MTTYKRPEFLKNQLNSLLKQTFKNFHVIISDNDCSKREVIVNEINDPRISYHAMKKIWAWLKASIRV